MAMNGVRPFKEMLIKSVAMFNWDTEKSSKKLVIEDDQLTVKVKDGSGFKTSLGD